MRNMQRAYITAWKCCILRLRLHMSRQPATSYFPNPSCLLSKHPYSPVFLQTQGLILCIFFTGSPSSWWLYTGMPRTSRHWPPWATRLCSLCDLFQPHYMRWCPHFYHWLHCSPSFDTDDILLLCLTQPRTTSNRSGKVLQRKGLRPQLSKTGNRNITRDGVNQNF